MTERPAICAAPPPADRDARAVALREALYTTFSWHGVADLVLSWLAYERQLSQDVVALKLRAERAEDAKQRRIENEAIREEREAERDDRLWQELYSEWGKP